MATSAQVLITYMSAAGRPVTNQTHHTRRVCHNQTVTPIRANAASNWLLAPKRLQKVFQAGMVLPSGAILGGCNRK